MDYITPAIRDDFAAVNRLVIERLHSDVALVESIGQYIVEGGGKRMRPLITLLCARALGYAGCGAGAPPPMPTGAMRPACWWVTSSIAAPSRCWSA
jgi:geranylgeranyl pyrophosphate synthase